MNTVLNRIYHMKTLVTKEHVQCLDHKIEKMIECESVEDIHHLFDIVVNLYIDSVLLLSKEHTLSMYFV